MRKSIVLSVSDKKWAFFQILSDLFSVILLSLYYFLALVTFNVLLSLLVRLILLYLFQKRTLRIIFRRVFLHRIINTFHICTLFWIPIFVDIRQTDTIIFQLFDQAVRYPRVHLYYFQFIASVLDSLFNHVSFLLFLFLLHLLHLLEFFKRTLYLLLHPLRLFLLIYRLVSSNLVHPGNKIRRSFKILRVRVISMRFLTLFHSRIIYFGFLYLMVHTLKLLQ